MASEAQWQNMVVGNEIRFQMLLLGAVIRPTQFNSTIYTLGNTYRYAQLEYFYSEGYKLRLKWYKSCQFRTSDADQMRAAWRQWRGE